MQTDRWERIKEILELVEPLRGEARARRLDEACGSDVELRAEVTSLLEAAGGASDVLDVVDTVGDTPGYQGGEQIGPYRLAERLGHGGMGEVWLAEQTDPVRRDVALKIVKLGMDTRQIVARFEAERQALAMLEHDNIAKLFDAGVTEDGRPYFAMELVRGMPITEYCDERRLDVAERVELFAQVARAVHHAHERGLIHRDLKPSNILVSEGDGGPHIKLIDFGIAKALGADLTDRTLHTRADQILGTPEYMSPEQAGLDGEPIDARSDVYSLGVVLYELLIGSRPYELGNATGYGALAEVLRHRETPAPSSRVTSASDPKLLATTRATSLGGLRRLLRSGLDPIVMTAMEPERDARYRSAAALADDLDRFRAGEPLSVRQGTRDRAVRSLLMIRRRYGTELRVAAGIAVIAIASWAGALAAQGPVVAVLQPASFQGGDDALENFNEGSQATLIGQFSANGYRVVSPERIASASEALGEDPYRASARNSAAVAVGRAVEADIVVMMMFTEIVGRVRLDLRAYDAETGEEMVIARRQGRINELFPLLESAALEVVAVLDGRAEPTGQPVPVLGADGESIQPPDRLERLGPSPEGPPDWSRELLIARTAMIAGDIDLAIEITERLQREHPDEAGPRDVRELIRQEHGR